MPNEERSGVNLYEAKNVNIRNAVNLDSNEIKSLVFEVLTEYGLTPDPEETDKDLNNIEQMYGANGGYFGVVEDEGKIVATVAIFKISPDTCELRKMYILPSQRGKGLGRKLMDFSLDKAKCLGFTRVVLETASPLKEAIGLYRRYGFTEYFPDHLSSRCDQAYELDL